MQGARPRPGGAGGGAGTFTRHLPGDPSTASNPSSHFLPLGGQRKLKKAGLLRRLRTRDFPLGARGGWRSFLRSDEAAASQKRLEGDRGNAECLCRVFRQK